MWGGHEPKARGPKPTHTLATILDAAIEIADRDGVSALSMQRLSSDLGFSTMALYRYVDRKEDLLDLMLDHVMRAPPSREPAGWRRALESWALAEWKLLREHPWALELVSTRNYIGPNRMAWLAVAYQAMSPVGLTMQEVLLTIISIDRYVRGAARDALAPIADDRPAAEVWWAAHEPFVAARFPDLASALSDVATRIQDPPDAELAHGLGLILDGIEAFIARKRDA